MTRALLAAVLLLLALLGWQWGRAEQAGRRADVAVGALGAAQKARLDEAKARETESKRAHRLQEALDAEHLARLAFEADLRTADASAVGLHKPARIPALPAAAKQPAPPPICLRSCVSGLTSERVSLRDMPIRLGSPASPASAPTKP
jgi:hypothetical protein